MRIYTDMGDKEKAARWKKSLDDPDYKRLKRCMPESLMDDLESRDLLD